MSEIKNYSIRFNGGPIVADANPKVRSSIHLFDKSSKMVGYISFYEEGADIPKDQATPYVSMNLPVSLLHSVIDVLRNENPIYLVWHEHFSHAYLSTTQEPTGEGPEDGTEA